MSCIVLPKLAISAGNHKPHKTLFTYAIVVSAPAILAHRVAANLDAVAFVNGPVEDFFRHARIQDLLMPACHT